MLRHNGPGGFTEVRLQVAVPFEGPPRLRLHVHRPRILLMQRFVLDVIFGVQLFIVRAIPSRPEPEQARIWASTAVHQVAFYH